MVLNYVNNRYHYYAVRCLKFPAFSNLFGKPSLMKSPRKWIRDLFGFSTTEINGFLILVPLMTALAVSEPLYRWWIASQPRDYAADLGELNSLVAQWKVPERDSAVIPGPSVFDPNTATESTLRAVGFSEILSKRIAAYRRKGGVFRTKSDLAKIYGLDSALYHQLYDYIDLPAERLPTRLADQRPHRQGKRSAKAPQVIFDINTADTLLLETIYGIGPTLAARIIKFRDRLGGFVKEEQLYEVYGLDSTVVSRLLHASYVQEGFEPKKININTAGEEMLAAHPYIRYNLARRITSYRLQHGDFHEVSDIKKISASANDNLDRLLTYIKTKD